MPIRNVHRPGMVLVYLCVAMVALFAIAALSVDFSRVQIVRAQLRSLADSAALYGATGISQGLGTAWAQAAAADNSVDGSTITLLSSDIQTGNWASGAFTANGTPTNAIQVTAYYSTSRNGGVAPYFGSIIGMGKMNLSATAVATIGTTPPYEIVGLNYVNISGDGTDSFNSATSTTGYTNPSYSGNVESNGNITLSGSAEIKGNALAGIGDSVSTSGSASVSGTSGNVPKALSFPNASAGSYATTNSNSSIPAANLDSHGNFNVSGGNSVVLPGGNYYVGDFVLSGGSTVSFTGPAVVYVTGKVDLSGGSVTTDGSSAENLQFQVIGSGQVTLSGSTVTYADIYAPQSDFTISGQSQLAGRVIAASITDSGSATIHADQALTATTGNPTLVQ